jgi:hypothetical protein
MSQVGRVSDSVTRHNGNINVHSIIRAFVGLRLPPNPTYKSRSPTGLSQGFDYGVLLNIMAEFKRSRRVK